MVVKNILLKIIKGLRYRLQEIAGKYRAIPRAKRKRFWLITTSLTAVMVFLIFSSIAFSIYSPVKSAPFPYIPPPEGATVYYIETSVSAIELSFISEYTAPFDTEFFKGQSFIFKKIEITEWIKSRSNESYIMTDMIQFVAKNPSDLKRLKVGDKFDVIGICDGNLEGYETVGVFKDCLFLPLDTAPLLLPGGPAPITGGY